MLASEVETSKGEAGESGKDEQIQRSLRRFK